MDLFIYSSYKDAGQQRLLEGGEDNEFHFFVRAREPQGIVMSWRWIKLWGLSNLRSADLHDVIMLFFV